jgi:hypothetical protein
MRTITRKTNVRRHDRHTKKKVADVRNHLRKVVRPVLGVVEIKDLTYKQAKRRFPTLAPFGDIDQDGVINKRDCRPFDEERQDEEDDLIQCPHCWGYGGGSGPGMECPLCNRKGKVTNELREKYLEKDWLHMEKAMTGIRKLREQEAEERARRASPKGDYDGDGVPNAKDCHPLDPNRQDDDEKEWRECKKCGYKVYDYPYSICPNCRRDWEEAFKKRDTRR